MKIAFTFLNWGDNAIFEFQPCFTFRAAPYRDIVESSHLTGFAYKTPAPSLMPNYNAAAIIVYSKNVPKVDAQRLLHLIVVCNASSC